MVPLDLSTLARPPEFHLDRLLELLAKVEDGESTHRTLGSENKSGLSGWALSAGGYFIDVVPNFQCGFDELGDGKVLTAIMRRLVDSEGQASLTTSPIFKDPPKGMRMGTFLQMGWRAGVKLGPETDSPMTHKCGSAFGEFPGTALLVAYLRAWGVVEA